MSGSKPGASWGEPPDLLADAASNSRTRPTYEAPPRLSTNAPARPPATGQLMRTAPVALAYLNDPDGLIEAASSLSALTHADPEAGEACALWCLAIRYAVLHGSFDGVHGELQRLPAERAAVWEGRLQEAETHDSAHFKHNGWVVQALQGAWSAIHRTQSQTDAGASFPASHLRRALEAAVRGGRDTDTVAAIAGSLLGARWVLPPSPHPGGAGCTAGLGCGPATWSDSGR